MTLKESVNAVYMWSSGEEVSTPSTIEHSEIKTI